MGFGFGGNEVRQGDQGYLYGKRYGGQNFWLERACICFCYRFKFLDLQCRN
jgi:hypothetical protein